MVPGLSLPGVDLISACDIRYCAQDAFFQVKVRHFLSSCLLEPSGDGHPQARVQERQCGPRQLVLKASWKEVRQNQVPPHQGRHGEAQLVVSVPEKLRLPGHCVRGEHYDLFPFHCNKILGKAT